MRLLLRLLLLLILGSYLFSRYGFFLHENLWHTYSAERREFLYRPAERAKDQSQSVHADLPPLHRRTIRLFRHGCTVTRRTYGKIVDFLKAHT